MLFLICCTIVLIEVAMSKPKIDRNIDVPDSLIKDLLTISEKRMVKQRLLIIRLLEEGLSIRSIADQAKVGTDTVVRVARMLEANPRIREFLRKPKLLTSKWVFGQISSEKE